MIIIKVGLCCRFVFPLIILVKDKVIYFFYYTVIISFVAYSLLIYLSSPSTLSPSYGVLLMTLVILLWIPTTYARYQRGYWKDFPTYRVRVSLLMLLLFMVFSSQSLLTLFIFFELCLVPIISIIFMGGNSRKKIEAGLYMFSFTSFSAFTFLVFLVFLCSTQHGFAYFTASAYRCYNSFFSSGELGASISCFFYNLTTVMMLVKTPLFFVHIWLPKAHVEAPVFASMILARLLLKTGGFGYLILYINLYGVLAHYDYALCGALVLSILAAVRCSAQKDIKMLIAYSSVNHMRVILCGIVLGFRCSVLGRVILIIGHGIISSVLFYLARDRYGQTRTRSSFFSLVLSKRNINILFWLRLTFINAGLPPFLMFTGEVIIFKASLIFPYLMFLFFLNYTLIGCYSCLILIKLILSKFPLNVGRLINVGLSPFICNSVVLLHFLLLTNMSITSPWFI